MPRVTNHSIYESIAEMRAEIREVKQAFSTLRADFKEIEERLRMLELQMKSINGIGDRVRILEEGKYKLMALALLLILLGSGFGSAIFNWLRISYWR